MQVSTMEEGAGDAVAELARPTALW